MRSKKWCIVGVILLLFAGFFFIIMIAGKALLFRTGSEIRSTKVEQRTINSYQLQIGNERVEGTTYVSLVVKDVESGKETIIEKETFRALDFKWCVWEENSYHIWVKSGDLGTFCFVYEEDWECYALSKENGQYYLSPSSQLESSTDWEIDLEEALPEHYQDIAQ